MRQFIWTYRYHAEWLILNSFIWVHWPNSWSLITHSCGKTFLVGHQLIKVSNIVCYYFWQKLLARKTTEWFIVMRCPRFQTNYAGCNIHSHTSKGCSSQTNKQTNMQNYCQEIDINFLWGLGGWNGSSIPQNLSPLPSPGWPHMASLNDEGEKLGKTMVTPSPIQLFLPSLTDSWKYFMCFSLELKETW